MSTGFAGAYGLMPGQTGVFETSEVAFRWGKNDLCLVGSGILSSAARDAGNTPTTTLRAGLGLGQVTASGKLLQYDGDAADGTDFLYGFLMNATSVLDVDGTAVDKFIKVCLFAPIKANQIPNLDDQMRAQAAGRFFFDDRNYGPNPFGWRRTIAKATNYTVVSGTDNGTQFTTTGAAGAVTFTLPAVALSIKGQKFRFWNTADQNMVVAAPADTLVVTGDAAATSITFSTPGQKIGACVEVVADETGAKWMASVQCANPFVVA